MYIVSICMHIPKINSYKFSVYQRFLFPHDALSAFPRSSPRLRLSSSTSDSSSVIMSDYLQIYVVSYIYIIHVYIYVYVQFSAVVFVCLHHTFICFCFVISAVAAVILRVSLSLCVAGSAKSPLAFLEQRANQLIFQTNARRWWPEVGVE